MQPAPNRHRGEIVAELDGRRWTLCLTLGALADLEASFGAADLADLAARLGSGHLGAGQMAAILAAGLRGGGHEVSDAEVARMHCPGGLAGLARVVADLVAATFGADGPPVQPDAPPDPLPNPLPPRGEG